MIYNINFSGFQHAADHVSWRFKFQPSANLMNYLSEIGGARFLHRAGGGDVKIGSDLGLERFRAQPKWEIPVKQGDSQSAVYIDQRDLYDC